MSRSQQIGYEWSQMLIPTQTYCLTQFAGLVFPDLLLMSLSVWFTSHFGFLLLNYMKMALPFVIQSSLQSCAWLFPVSISVTCYPNHFPFIQLLILLTVEPAVATDLTVEPPTNPDFIKCLPCSLRQGPWQLPTAPPHPSRHHTSDQTAFGCLPPIGWISRICPKCSTHSHTIQGCEKAALHALLLSCLIEFIRCSKHLLSLFTAEIKPWSSW